ncbi:MAG: tetratricopeptide repeat protein [Nitrospiraceae bacterium]
MNAVITFLILPLIVLLGACATASIPLGTPPGADSVAAAHNAEGIEHYTMAHWGIAKTHFASAAQVSPQMAEAHYNLALALDQLGDHAEAAAHFKKAAELAPNNTAITQSDVYLYHVNLLRNSSGTGIPRPITGGY